MSKHEHLKDIKINSLVLKELAKTYEKFFPTQILGQTQVDIIAHSPGNNVNRGTRDRYLVRSHPNFQSGGPWYEWCLIDFGKAHGSSHPPDPHPGITPLTWFPGKVLAIFKHPRPEGTKPPDGYKPPQRVGDDDQPNDPEQIGASRMMVLVHTCTPSDHESDSRLTEVWEKEFRIPKTPGSTQRRRSTGPLPDLVPRLRIVPVESIVKRIYVVEEYPQVLHRFPNTGNNDFSRVVYLKDMIEYWPLSFNKTLSKSML
jgi:hypothetical protein